MTLPSRLSLDNVPSPTKDYDPETDYDTSNESLAGTGVRGAVRSVARFGEGALGAYGDAQNLRKSAEDFIIDKASSYIPGGEIPQKIVGEGLKVATKGPVRYTQEKLVDEPFGSTDLFKQISNEITSGYTKPTSETEKNIDEVFTMAGQLALGGPQGAGQTFARKLFTDLGLSAVNKLSKEGVKLYGGGPIAQEATGLGAMILSSFLGRANPRQIASDLYQLRDSRITPNTMAPVSDLTTDLMAIRNQLSLGGRPTPAQNALIGEIDTIMSKYQAGGIPVEELTAWQTQLNRLRSNYPEIRFDNRQIDPIRQANQRAIGQGLQNDPVALTAHREGNEAFAANAQSQTMTNFIERYIPKHLQSGAVGALIGKTVGNLSSLIPGATAIGTAAAGLYGARIIRHVMQSPVLRREYGNLMRSVSQENVPAAINSATKLNKQLEDDKKLQKELKDTKRLDLDLVR